MVMQSAVYGQEHLHYQVCFVPNLRGKVAIHVHPNGAVQVDAPDDTDLAEVKRAVLKRASWVLGHLRNAREQREHVLRREYVSGESFFYLGRRHVLKIVAVDNPEAAVKMVKGQLVVETDDRNPETIKTAMWAWYVEHAKSYFEQRMLAVCSQIPWVPDVPQWRLRAMRTQWGSCSPKGSLSLNPHLVKAPRDCIDYVLMHELCHLREHNHSKKFYNLLTETLPEWRSVKAKLDGMAELLLNE